MSRPRKAAIALGPSRTIGFNGGVIPPDDHHRGLARDWGPVSLGGAHSPHLLAVAQKVSVAVLGRLIAVLDEGVHDLRLPAVEPIGVGRISRRDAGIVGVR